MLTQIAEAIASASLTRSIAIAGNLRDTGLALAGALLTWFVAWRALRVATDARDSLTEFFADVVEKLVLAAIVLWLLQTTIYASLIQEWIWNGLRSIALGAAGLQSSVPGTGPLEAMELSLDQFRDGVVAALVKVDDSIATGFDPMSWLGNILRNQLLPFVVAGIVIVILAVAKALAVGAFCVGAVMFGVGAALGPLFVPLLLAERLDHYFWSWLRFEIVAGGTLIVGVIVILLLAEALRPIAGPDGSLSGEFNALVQASSVNGADFLAAATKCVVVALFLAYVLSQIPEITNALFSGSTAGIRSGAGAGMRWAARGGSRALGVIERRLITGASRRTSAGPRPGGGLPPPTRGGGGGQSSAGPAVPASGNGARSPEASTLTRVGRNDDAPG